MKYLLYGFLVTAWAAGIALAKGGWMTAAAVLPPVSWVLVASKALEVWGWK